VAVSPDYLEYILEQLAALGALRAQRMFGAAGLYCEELFFGIISEDTLYLRTDEAGRAQFTQLGMQPFRPYADRPQVSLNYYEVPAQVLEDAGALVSWSRRAMAVALSAARLPRSRGGRRGHASGRSPRPRRS
jgi:DNA transformation protein and related proteins